MKSKLLKSVSLALALSICLTILPSFPAFAQEPLVQITAPIDPERITSEQLQTMVLPDEDRPEAVEAYLVEQKGHVLRLREEETNHNTVVFQNRDGNKTMYYFDQPVKYVDENGDIKDKKTTVTSVIDKAEYSADYGFVTSDNDIKTYFPKKLGNNKGVILEHQDAKIEVAPLSSSKNVSTDSTAQKKQKQIDSQISDSVEYNKAFGNNTLLKYTPTLNGFKEDIILTSYTGENRFSFKIKTNGLSLVCEDGVYYLVDPITDEKVMQVGNIIVYDSSMIPNTTPSTPDLNPVKPEPEELTEEEKNALYFPEGPSDPVYEHYYQLETVKESEEYILTIVVDEDYLNCEDTVYPVTIDPSLTVVGSTFEDVTIYTNYTSNQGASLNMFVGDYTARYGGTKGVARALIRFPGLFSNSTFASLTPNNIISVDFMVRDTMCEGDAVWVDCYRMNQSWSESTAVYSSSLWNGYTGSYIDDQYVQYNGGTGSNGTGTGHWYHFDITAVVKEWMNGYYGGVNNHYGIMLKAYNETNSAKTFGTSDNTNYPPKLVVDYDDGDHGALPVSSVQFSQDEYVVPVGWTGTFDVEVYPEGAVSGGFNWVLIGSHDIATITAGGVFTAIAEGTKELVVGAKNGGSGDICTVRIIDSDGIQPMLTYPDTLISDANTRDKLVSLKTIAYETQLKHYNGEIPLSMLTDCLEQIENQCDVIRADYILVGNNPTSDYAYAALGGDSSASVPYSFSRNLSLDMSGLDVVVVQRTLELLGYYEPDDDTLYGTFDQNTYESALAYSYLLSYENGQYIFDNASFNVLFGITTLDERTYEALNNLNKYRVTHDIVAQWAAEKVEGTYEKKYNKITNGSVSGRNFGYADVLKDTGNKTYIWEVKPDKAAYYSSGGIGDIQIQRYLNAGKKYTQNFSKPLVTGYNLGTATLPHVNGQYIHIRSFINPAYSEDPRNGLVLYEVNTSPNPVLETLPAFSVETSYEFETEHVVNTAIGIVIIVGLVATPADEIYLVVREIAEAVYYYVSIRSLT